jgi:hypothetical protein
MIETGTAVFLGNEDAHHSELAQLRNDLGRKSMRTVGLDSGLIEFFARKAPRSIARASLRFCQFQIHLNSE